MESQLQQSSTPKKMETDVPDEQPLSPPFAPPLSFKSSRTFEIVDPGPKKEPSESEFTYQGDTYKIPASYLKAYLDRKATDKNICFVRVIDGIMLKRHYLNKPTPVATKD